MSIIGSRDKAPFAIPTANTESGQSGRRFYTRVNEITGDVEVRRTASNLPFPFPNINPLATVMGDGADTVIGKYIDGKFVPATNLTPESRQQAVYFGSEVGTRNTLNQAVILLERETGRTKSDAARLVSAPTAPTSTTSASGAGGAGGATNAQNPAGSGSNSGTAGDNADNADGTPPEPTRPANTELESAGTAKDLRAIGGGDEGDVNYASSDMLGGVPLVIRYPLNMRNTQDRIKFQVKQVKIPEPDRGIRTFGAAAPGSFNFSFGTKNFTDFGDPIYIGIQGSISDQNRVTWGGEPADAIKVAQYVEAIKFMKTQGGDATSAVKDILSRLTNQGYKYQSPIQRSIAGAATGGLNNLLARTDDVIFNPNLELLFNSVELRSFTFNFKLSPRSQREGVVVRRIINFFKYNMLPKKGNDGLFIRSPRVFDIQYLKGSSTRTGTPSEHDSLNKIKTCALMDCSVNYTPNASYSRYEDGTMTAYEINLQFQELYPIYDTDYDDPSFKTGDNFNKNKIGY